MSLMHQICLIRGTLGRIPNGPTNLSAAPGSCRAIEDLTEIRRAADLTALERDLQAIECAARRMAPAQRRTRGDRHGEGQRTQAEVPGGVAGGIATGDQRPG